MYNTAFDIMFTVGQRFTSKTPESNMLSQLLFMYECKYISLSFSFHFSFTLNFIFVWVSHREIKHHKRKKWTIDLYFKSGVYLFCLPLHIRKLSHYKYYNGNLEIRFSRKLSNGENNTKFVC